MKLGPMIATVTTVGVLGLLGLSPAQSSRARDPGPRGGDAGAGAPLDGLTAREEMFFTVGLEDFSEAEGIGDGLGPRFNLDSCLGCHSHPAPGGSSPPVNPQVAMATAFGARNEVPPFVTANGPVREARFKYQRDGTRDGGVHALFVISGRHDDTGDASDCAIQQDDFAGQLSRGNVIFRIPTPLFGAGLIEHIPDRNIRANRDANVTTKRSFGVGGRANIFRGTTNNNANDGTIAKFGWKAQNASLLLFSGEAYNVEMGITNELFPSERDGTPSCQYAKLPNDATDTEADTQLGHINAIQKFAFFMRFLAPPTPSTTTPGGALSIGRGRALFGQVGCALCHTPTLRTGDAAVAALNDKPVNLYSDLLLHHMGAGLADEIVQGEADGDEFRTAPLWGLGQRLFLLHDGRTRDLVEAIQAHRSGSSSRYPASEGNAAVSAYNGLGESQKQDLLNFLRSL